MKTQVILESGDAHSDILALKQKKPTLTVLSGEIDMGGFD